MEQYVSAILPHLTKQNRAPSLCPFKSPVYQQNCSIAFKVAGTLDTPSIECSSYKIQGNRRGIQHFIDSPVHVHLFALLGQQTEMVTMQLSHTTICKVCLVCWMLCSLAIHDQKIFSIRDSYAKSCRLDWGPMNSAQNTHKCKLHDIR